MQVAGIATQVEVSTSAADLLLESTATTGTVMSDKVAKELPLIGNDVLGLVNVMGGVVKAGEYDIWQFRPDFCRSFGRQYQYYS